MSHLQPSNVQPSTPQVVVVMGVAGSGKTTVGRLLAEELGWSFFDGDDYHPPANVAKMAGGQPLTDADRAAWLDALRTLIDDCLARSESAVVACSALRAAYRQRLGTDRPALHLVYLEGDFETIRARLAARRGHFFDPRLLASQFATLEPPTDALTIPITHPPDEIVADVRARLGA